MNVMTPPMSTVIILACLVVITEYMDYHISPVIQFRPLEIIKSIEISTNKTLHILQNIKYYSQHLMQILPSSFIKGKFTESHKIYLCCRFIEFIEELGLNDERFMVK